MTKTKHTPGYWEYSKAISPNLIFIKKVNDTQEDSLIGAIGGGLQTPEEIEANAKLVAAAPQLLEACQAAMALLNEKCMGGSARQLLIAAINKATV